MSADLSSRRQNFDNLSYIPDGRDRISYVNTAQDRNEVVLQAANLKKSKHETIPNYSYQSGRDRIYAYNNAAFSDISGTEGPSIRSQHPNLYALEKQFGAPTDSHGKVYRICSKYWYIFVILSLIILVGIGLGIGLGVYYSRDRSYECDLSCGPSEIVVQINSTHCECHFHNECQVNPTICDPFPCKKFNGTGYECECTAGYQHPLMTNDLTTCEDIDECENTNICDENQICNNTIGSYTCSCKSGYEAISTDNGFVCEDINECNGTNHCVNGLCKNTNGSFQCVCYSGYRLDPFNSFLCEDINECYSYNCTGKYEICSNTPGSYQCICDMGYRRDALNQCININECAESSNSCDANSRCEDRNGSFACCIGRISNQCIECGYDYSNGSSIVGNHVRRTRMINGEPVERGQFPWIAVLLTNPNYIESDSRLICSASIISSWNLLTAAHCLDEQLFRTRWTITHEPNSFKDLFDIRLDIYNLSMNSTEFLQSQSYSIENFTLHSGYESLGSSNAIVKNDLALIKLTKRIERSTNIDWICLPTQVNVDDQDILKVVSYGNIHQEQLNIRVLQNQRTQIECQRQISDIAEDAFCAISVTNTSFLGTGDSGAGAMIFKNNRWQLAGMMSKTGREKAYSAMTNISMHIDWLQSLVER